MISAHLEDPPSSGLADRTDDDSMSQIVRGFATELRIRDTPLGLLPLIRYPL